MPVGRFVDRNMSGSLCQRIFAAIRIDFVGSRVISVAGRTILVFGKMGILVFNLAASGLLRSPVIAFTRGSTHACRGTMLCTFLSLQDGRAPEFGNHGGVHVVDDNAIDVIVVIAMSL